MGCRKPGFNKCDELLTAICLIALNFSWSITSTVKLVDKRKICDYLYNIKCIKKKERKKSNIQELI